MQPSVNQPFPINISVNKETNTKHSEFKPQSNHSNQHKRTISSSPSSRHQVSIGTTIISENVGWDHTPYKYGSETIYLVLLDRKGRFVSYFRPIDFLTMKPMKVNGEFPWMKSYVYHSQINQPFFPVACDSKGCILDGVKKL